MAYNTLALNTFKSGLVTRLPDIKIPEDAFSDVENIELDDKMLPTKDKGHSKYNATKIGDSTCRGGFVYLQNDGTKHYVVACGGKLYYSVAGSGTWTAYQIGGADLTLDSDSDVEIVQYNNILYVVNGKYPIITNTGHSTSRMIKISNTTVSSLTASDIPQGAKYLIVHNERLFAASTTDQPNGLYWTEPYSPEDWTPDYGLNYDYVGKDDGETIKSIKSYQGYVYVLKPKNIYRYSTQGDITQWGSQRCDTRLGAMHNRTVHEFYGYLMYLSPEGVVKFDGNNATLVDGNIRDRILALPQLKSNVRQWTQTTTTDFESGTYGAKLIDKSDNQLTMIPQTSQADWDAGTKTNVETTTSVGDVKMLPNSSSAYGTDKALNQTVTAYGLGGVVSPTYAVDGNDTTRTTFGYHGTSAADYLYVDLGSSLRVRSVRLKYRFYYTTVDTALHWYYSTNGSSWTEFNTSTVPTVPTGNATDYDVTKDLTAPIVARYIKVQVQVKDMQWYIYSLNVYEAYSDSSSIVTQTLDYGFTPASLGSLAAEVTVPTGTSITFQTRTSADGNTWDAFSNIGTAGENGGAINSTAKRYLQWKAILSTNTAGTETPILSQGYVGGIWRSEVHDLGVTPASWGKFESAYTANSQTITFWMRSAAASGDVPSATWYQQTPGIPIVSVGLYRYIQVEVRFSTNLYSQVPTMDSYLITFYTSTNLVNPCAVVWKNNYWLNVTAPGYTYNNVCYKYNVNDYWLYRTNKKNNVYFMDEDNLLSGCSEATGFVRYNDIGNQDDGSDITSYFVTKNFELSNMINIFRNILLTFKSDANWTLSYSIDNGDYTDITITASSLITTIRKVFTGIVRGQFIKFKFTQSAQDSNWQIDGMGVEYAPWRKLNG